MPPAIDDQKWDTKLRELEKFRNENGHCNVPRSHPSLGRWVDWQRTNTKNGKLSSRRKGLLEQLGFEFRRQVHKVEGWDRKFNELQKFKIEHGHCNVLQSQRSLGPWVSNQRAYKRRGTLSVARERKLKGIGFDFRLRAWRPFACELEDEDDATEGDDTSQIDGREGGGAGTGGGFSAGGTVSGSVNKDTGSRRSRMLQPARTESEAVDGANRKEKRAREGQLKKSQAQAHRSKRARRTVGGEGGNSNARSVAALATGGAGVAHNENKTRDFKACDVQEPAREQHMHRVRELEERLQAAERRLRIAESEAKSLKDIIEERAAAHSAQVRELEERLRAAECNVNGQQQRTLERGSGGKGGRNTGGGVSRRSKRVRNQESNLVWLQKFKLWNNV